VQKIPFDPSLFQNFSFSPELDGDTYFCEVQWLSVTERWWLELRDSSQAVICYQPLIASCDCGDIQLFAQLKFNTNIIYRASAKAFEIGGVKRDDCPESWIPPSPPMPIYALSVDTALINEGEPVTITVTTTNVPDGTTLYLTVLDITTEGAADLTPINGSVVINSGTADFIITANADAVMDDNETFVVQLRLGSITGMVVAVSEVITIVDVAPQTWILRDPFYIGETLASNPMGVSANGDYSNLIAWSDSTSLFTSSDAGVTWTWLEGYSAVEQIFIDTDTTVLVSPYGGSAPQDLYIYPSIVSEIPTNEYIVADFIQLNNGNLILSCGASFLHRDALRLLSGDKIKQSQEAVDAQAEFIRNEMISGSFSRDTNKQARAMKFLNYQSPLRQYRTGQNP